MRPYVIPLSLLLALALLGAGGQSVAKAAVPFQTPEPLETPLPTLAERTAEADQAADETARAMAPVAPKPYVLHTPEPLITPLPRPVHHPVAKPAPVATPMVIALPTGKARNKGVTFSNGGVVYNLVFPLVGAPAPGQDFSVKLTNKPNSNQVEVSLTSPHGQAPAKHSQGPSDIQVQVSAPNSCAVEFSLDGQHVGEDADGTDGFALALDTSRYTNGFHALKAVARDDRGAVVQTVEHMVLIQN